MQTAASNGADTVAFFLDIFGDFDMAEAGQKFLNNMLQESQKRNQN